MWAFWGLGLPGFPRRGLRNTDFPRQRAVERSRIVSSMSVRGSLALTTS